MVEVVNCSEMGKTMFLCLLALPTSKSVSYTHLDVYKRQVPGHMLGNVREIEYLRDNKTAAKIDIRFQKYEGRKQKQDS